MLEARTPMQGAAIRTDADRGFREEHEFFGTRGRRMLGCLHLPLRVPKAGVVVCSSVRSEFETNYRREILLGRALAVLGVATLRFQYLGTGNSDGAEEDVTLESMEADGVAAAAHLAARCDVSRIGFVGTRLGGVVAARLASRHPGAPLSLWEPVVDPGREFRHIFRSRRFWAAKEEGESHAPSESALDELRRRGVVDVLGHPIHQPLYESATRCRIETDVGTDPRPVLLVQLGTRGGLRPQYAALAERWGETGFSLACMVVDEQESWWLEPPGEAQEKRTLVSSAAVEVTGAWLQGKLEEGVDA